LDKKLPILIICQGSGYDSNTKGFLRIASKFSEQVAGLVIEKQGVKYGDKGDSLTQEYKDHNVVYNRVYDYLRVLQYLRANAGWWNGDVYVVGGSEGGLLAGMIASFYPGVKGLGILCYGGGLKFGEAWPVSSGMQVKSDGGDSLAVKKEEAATRDTLELARLNANFIQSYNNEDNTYAWWASSTDLRLSNSLVDLKIPIFVAQGTEDMMALPASAQKLQKVFLERKKYNLQYKEYIGYDHGFRDKESKSHLGEVLTEAITWILNDPKIH
ncbi:MAG: alpha/beta hydrolase, partial [Ferruginibacter sp.]